VSRFTDLPSGERAVYVRETAARLNITQQIVEKDFWVCWTLRLLFSRPEFAPHVVFKGGTSLSKVFKVIGRFSEDIDLSIGLPLLGYDDSFLTADTSPTQMRRHIERVEAKCAAFVKNEFRVTLENTIRDELGQRSGGGNWLEYQVEGATKSPVLVFRYPAVIPPEAGASYIEQSVKMELGSLTDQRPVGRHRIAPLIAEIVAEGDFEDFSGEVVALEVERTFWEKATILHAESTDQKRRRSRIAWHDTTQTSPTCGNIRLACLHERSLTCWHVWSRSNLGTTRQSGRATIWRGQGRYGSVPLRPANRNWRKTTGAWQLCTFKNHCLSWKSSRRSSKRRLK
jgi:hypothetical protein